MALYTKTKLKDDAKKLDRLTSETLAEYGTVHNLVMLWDIKEERLTKNTSHSAMTEFKKAASSIRLSGPTSAVAPLIASSIDLFVAKSGSGRRATVGLFAVTH